MKYIQRDILTYFRKFYDTFLNTSRNSLETQLSNRELFTQEKQNLKIMKKESIII